MTAGHLVAQSTGDNAHRNWAATFIQTCDAPPGAAQRPPVSNPRCGFRPRGVRRKLGATTAAGIVSLPDLRSASHNPAAKNSRRVMANCVVQSGPGPSFLG